MNNTGVNLLVVFVADYSGSGATSSGTITDSSSNVWTETGTVSNNNHRETVWYSSSPTVSASQTVTFTCFLGDQCFPVMQVLSYSGAKATTPLDKVQCSGGPGGFSLQPGSITPLQNGEAFATGIAFASDLIGLTIDSGFSITDLSPSVAGQSFEGAAAQFIQGSASALNPTWSWTTNQSNNTCMASFLPAPSLTNNNAAVSSEL